MYEELEKRIDEQEVWTFRECLGLAVDFGLKTRMVIAQVLMQGKEYVDHENDHQAWHARTGLPSRNINCLHIPRIATDR